VGGLGIGTSGAIDDLLALEIRGWLPRVGGDPGSSAQALFLLVELVARVVL